MQLPDRCCGSTPPPLSLSPTFFTRAAQTPPLTHPSPATILVTPSCWAPAAATLTWHAPPPALPRCVLTPLAGSCSRQLVCGMGQCQTASPAVPCPLTFSRLAPI